MVKPPPRRAGISGLAESQFFGLCTLGFGLRAKILILPSWFLILKSWFWYLSSKILILYLAIWFFFNALFPSSRNSCKFLINIPAGGNRNLLLSTPGSASSTEGSAAADRYSWLNPATAGRHFRVSRIYILWTLYFGLCAKILILPSWFLILKSWL